jgi:hypothetical protein
LHAFLAAGGDIDELDKHGDTPRVLAGPLLRCTDDDIVAARRRIAKTRLDLVRHRAMQVCIGLQSLNLDALSMCEIMQQSCGPPWCSIPFHHWWRIATTVKHFH